MRVKPSQLIPGCILQKEVTGKSNRAIIPKDTVLEEKHITILHKFLVESVEVGSRMADGKAFIPAEVLDNQLEQPALFTDEEELPFQEHYVNVTKAYKKEFEKWKNSMPVDISRVRKLIIPLLEKIAYVNDKEIFSLNNHTKKEDYIYHHSVAVALISAYIGKKMGYSKGEWLQIGLAGLLSDCGMARMDMDIMLRTGPLTVAEWKDIKHHPTYSYRMIEKLPTITPGVKLAVLQHHERMDGSGYPLGIRDNKLHPYAKIIAVADTYHAMVSDRLYQSRISPFKIIEEIHKEQYLRFDGKVVTCLIHAFSNLIKGLKVILSNQERGEIVFVIPDKPTRPMVRMEEDGKIISLEQHPELFITAFAGD